MNLGPVIKYTQIVVLMLQISQEEDIFLSIDIWLPLRLLRSTLLLDIIAVELKVHNLNIMVSYCTY